MCHTYISASKILMHWHRPGFPVGSIRTFLCPPFGYAQRIYFCSKTSSLPTVNRPLYVQFCVPPEIHQRFADIHKLNPWRSMRIPYQHTCSLNAATSV